MEILAPPSTIEYEIDGNDLDVSATSVAKNSSPPPVVFDELKSQLQLEASVDSKIVRVISEKAGGSEGNQIEQNEVLDTYIDSEMEKLEDAIPWLSTDMAPISVLNHTFQSVIR
ncbi:MAG: nucleotidyltransferase domain-containing protein [Verrucomicrobiales bacterium]